uniref:NADH dehydrogenase subunit 4 n=1 Tax=Batracomorphus fuscomaculatus TaxID=3045904 RepID=UPI00257B9005|nr:NADH dehydrogenase subunit 4 [Batracomorphus fuscomaculatus]WHE42633.1 NADH dehydrogenase subunit 4 [Batracomorphus fuscomaculatus]
MMMIFMFLSLILIYFLLDIFSLQIIIILMIIFFFTTNFFSFYCSVTYMFGIDFYSFWMIFLLFFIFLLMILSFNFNNFYCFFLVMYFLLLSLFLIFYSLNILMMYFFFEFSLIPLLIMIFGWGYQPERLISGFYLFFYTVFSSLPLMIFIIWFYEFNSLFFDLNLNLSFSFYLNFCLIFSFLVKFPMFMLHFWLPKAHVQAPLFGSMVLAGLMLKVGGYGLIRFMIMFEDLFLYYGYIWYSLSLYGSMLVSYICLIQSDVKFMIAYSSVSHMGLCIMGLMSFYSLGFIGSYLMMICHGFCSSGLFCLASFYYNFIYSRSFFINKGMMIYFPTLCMFWFFFCSINMSCPPSVNFLSEFLIMNSMICYSYCSIYFMFFIFFFVSCFNFYMFSYMNHGKNYFSFSFNLGYMIDYFIIFFHLIYLFFFNFYFFFVLF